MKGILVFKGKALKPPFVVEQEAGKILINENVVYPFPEIEIPRERPLFKGGAELPEFRVPEKMWGVLKDFQKSWASGLIRDEKGLLERAAGLKRVEDYIRDETGRITDAGAYIRDYKAQKEALQRVLEREKIPFSETEEYHDVLIPVEKEWGIIALFNEAERVRVAVETDKKRPVPAKHPYEDASKIRQYIETGLKEGDMFIIDENQMELIPHQFIEKAAKEIANYDALTDDEKIEKLQDILIPDITNPEPLDMNSAVIFFPHLSWQKNIFGRNARFPFSLATKLKSRGYRVWVFTDTAVTLRTWAQILKNGSQTQMNVIYNQGHGGRNLIAVGERGVKKWLYFTDQFVYKYAALKKAVVYIHSCYSLFDDSMSAAFLSKGACTYGGWKLPTSASPDYCDRVDGIFWPSLVSMLSPTGKVCRALNEFDKQFECRGNSNCQIG